MKISVITITYNSAQYVRETINSVLSQTYQDLEYIIGDDCSTDASWSIVCEFSDPRIIRYRNEKNLGEYPNRMKAVQMATGEYLIFIDGDDILYPHALSVFAGYCRAYPECGMLFAREWDPRILYPFVVNPEAIYRFEYLDRGIIGGNFTKVLFRTSILQNETFPPDIRSGDTYIQLKIAQSQSALAIPDGLTWWRRRKGNATSQLFSNNRHVAESIRYRVALLENNCPLNETEKETARINIYGVFMRQLLYLAARLHLRDVFYLLKNVKLPREYYKALFIASKNNYYGNVSGENPLHSN